MMNGKELLEIFDLRRQAIKRYKNSYAEEDLLAYKKTLSTKELMGRPDERRLANQSERIQRLYKRVYVASQDLLGLPLLEHDSEMSVTRLFKASYFEQTLYEYGKLMDLLAGKSQLDDLSEEEIDQENERKWKERRSNGGL